MGLDAANSNNSKLKALFLWATEVGMVIFGESFAWNIGFLNNKQESSPLIATLFIAAISIINVFYISIGVHLLVVLTIWATIKLLI